MLSFGRQHNEGDGIISVDCCPVPGTVLGTLQISHLTLTLTRSLDEIDVVMLILQVNKVKPASH